MFLARLLPILFLALLIALIIFAFIAFLRIYGKSKSKEKDGAKLHDAGIRDLIMEERFEEAIEIYRRFTGIDMIAARKYVEDMAREIRLSDKTYQAVQRILKSEGKAAAIEAYQEQTGAVLADALAYVEAIEKRGK